jgi:transposase
VRRAYKFRLRPSARQHAALGQCLESHRELYNAALQERRDAWRLRRISIFYGDQSAQLKDIRKGRPDVGVWSFSSQQATLRRLNRAFARFFRRTKAGERPGYPRFRSAQRFDSVEWPEDGDGGRWQPSARRVYLQGIGQVLARKRRGSDNRRRAKETLAARHRKITNQRRNFHHHAARALVARYDLLVVENLKIRNMVRRPPPRPDPDQLGSFLPNGTAAKTGLNRSIHDAGWAQFVSILRAKAEEAGRVVIHTDARHTSDRREACGHTAKENRASQAVFSCRRCGHTVNADEHAARNILRAGLARLAVNPAA